MLRLMRTKQCHVCYGQSAYKQPYYQPTRTKQCPCPGAGDNRRQRKSELSINFGYVHEGQRTLAKACVNAGSHIC